MTFDKYATVQFKNIHVLCRLMCFILLSFSAGKISIEEVLNLISYLKNETSTAPIVETLLQLNDIYMLVEKRGDLSVSNLMKVPDLFPLIIFLTCHVSGYHHSICLWN